MARSRLKPDRVRGWLVAPLLAIAVVVLPVPAWAVDEFYSRDFYPWLQSGVTALSNLVPIAVLDLLIVGALFLLVYRAVQLTRLAGRLGWPSAIWEGIRRTLRAVAVVVLVFMIMWGLHYRRLPLEATLAPVAQPSAGTLQLAIADANALAASLRPKMPPAEDITYETVAARLEGPMDRALVALNRTPLARPGRPKFSLILTPFFTWSGVDGMIDPLALESIVHPDLLPVERPFLLAHEWAHLAGQADEAEASAVGWLACMKGGPEMAYSASLYLILEAGGALPPSLRRKAYSQLELGVRADLDQIALRMARQKPEVQRAAFRVYDSYLRANRVEDGTASYGRALTLILSAPLRNALNSYQIPAGTVR